jgi:hypothetical protein
VARFGVEDVHDHVAGIDEDPVARAAALGPDGPVAVLAKLLIDRVRDSATAFTCRSLAALMSTRKSAYEARPRTSRIRTSSAFLSRPACAAIAAAASASCVDSSPCICALA